MNQLITFIEWMAASLRNFGAWALFLFSLWIFIASLIALWQQDQRKD